MAADAAQKCALSHFKYASYLKIQKKTIISYTIII